MGYFQHDNEFGKDFIIKLDCIEKEIKSLYRLRDEHLSKTKKEFIRLHSSTIGPNSAFACLSAISKNQITMGKIVSRYENLFKEFLNDEYEILSCNSGSSANLIAISTLFQKGILKRGDKVIVPSLAWSTTVFPLIQYGLVPVFCDCNPNDFNLSIKNLEKLIRANNISAIMLIHTYGCPTNMDAICSICESNRLILIEDTCESMGAEWLGKKVGTFGNVSSFSTYYSHHICTLEGGFTCFKDKELSEVAQSIRSHGWIRHLSRDNKIFKENPHLDPGFLFNYVGYNLRLSEPQAAIGIEQIKSLNEFIFSRTKIAEIYTEFFKNFEDIFSIQNPEKEAKSSWFGYPILLKGRLKKERNALREFLFSRDIETRPFLAGDFTLQPVVDKFHHIKDNDLYVSREIAESGLAIPCHQSLKKDNAIYVIESFKEFIKFIQ